MGGKTRNVGTRRSELLQQKVDALEEENYLLTQDKEKLEAKVANILRVNVSQCQRLGEEALLRSRIAELETQIQDSDPSKEDSP